MAAIASPLSGVQNVHVNTLLSQFSIQYHPTGFIAEQVFPVVPVAKESDLYLSWDKGQAVRVLRSDGYGSLRADKTESKQVDFGGTWTNYKAQEWALKTAISDREKANADSAFNLETSKVRGTQDLVLLDYEIRVAKICTTVANYGANNVVTNAAATQWNNSGFASLTSTGSGHSAIAQQILAGRNAMRISSLGLLPNTIIIPYAVAMVMVNDPGFIDLVKYQMQNLNDTENVLPPKLWGMDVLIPRGEFVTTQEGEAVSPSDVWGKNVVMLYVDKNPGIGTLTFGMTLRQRPWQVKTWRQEWIAGTTFYEPSFVQIEKLITADCGYLIASAIA